MNYVYEIEIRFINDDGVLCKQLFELYKSGVDAQKRLNELKENNTSNDVSYHLYIVKVL